MESTLKRTWAEISLDNLTHNFETIRRQVGPKAKLLGVVKADAYGHGAVRVAKHLQRLGAGYLAVSNLDECEELRVNGITLPILMLGFTPADQAERILKNDMTQAVPNLAIAEAYSSAAVRAGGTMKVHIKLDTGMGRLGFQCDDAHFDASLRDILKILTLPGLDVEGVFTHFCVSDEAADECVEFTKIQHDRFLRMIDAVETQGNFRFRLHHCCNAGGIASYPEWAWDMVRCGIILYGTGDLAERMGMKPVMTVKTTVSTIKDFDPDTSISYGRQFFTTRPSRIAVLPIGYADGLPRNLSQKGGRVLIRGTFCPMVGRMCMDQLLVDVTDLPEAAPGDVVTLIGRDGAQELRAEELAARCGTITNELLSRLGRRLELQKVPRSSQSSGRSAETRG